MSSGLQRSSERNAKCDETVNKQLDIYKEIHVEVLLFYRTVFIEQFSHTDYCAIYRATDNKRLVTSKLATNDMRAPIYK